MALSLDLFGENFKVTDLYLTKLALDSGCAYIPPGMNVEPLYIFSVRELERFVELYKNSHNLKEEYDR